MHIFADVDLGAQVEDYYGLLGIDRGTTPDAIERKIRQELRIWQKRTANADLSRRQEAERRVQLLGEARATLLDETARRAYDQRLAAYRSPPQPQPSAAAAATASPAGSADWLEQARRHLAANDYLSAAYAARQARESGTPTAEVWSILARANAGLDNLDDAVYEARQAAALDSGNPQVHLDLAAIHEERGEWREAFGAYEAADRLTPGDDTPQFGMAMSLASAGAFDEAIGRLEHLLAHGEDRALAGLLLGQVLVVAAELVPQVRDEEGYVITSLDEAAVMGRLAARARQVTDDPEVLEAVFGIERYIAWCYTSHFQWHRFVNSGLLRLGGIGGLVLICLGGVSNSTTVGVFGFVVAIGSLVGAIAMANVPGWKLNRRAQGWS